MPLDARVILLGSDNSVWAPAGGEKAEGLWLHLRLLFCRAVWAQVLGNGRRCSAGGGGGALIAKAIIRMDWLRVTASLPATAVLPSWLVLH